VCRPKPRVQSSVAMIPSLQPRCCSFPQFHGCVALSPAVAAAVADRVAEAASQKPCKIKTVAVLRLRRGEAIAERVTGLSQPDEVTCLGWVHAPKWGPHSSGTPALRRPARSSKAYHASKGAVRIYSKAAAVRYGPSGVRVNTVHPGYMSPMLNSANAGERADKVAAIPLRRIGKPIEVAYGVLFLASDEASFITGAELVIDGGFIAQ